MSDIFEKVFEFRNFETVYTRFKMTHLSFSQYLILFIPDQIPFLICI